MPAAVPERARTTPVCTTVAQMDAATHALSGTGGRLVPAADAGADADWLNHVACSATLENCIYEKQMLEMK